MLMSSYLKVAVPEQEEEEAKVKESVVVKLKEVKPKEEKPAAKHLEKKKAHPAGKYIAKSVVLQKKSHQWFKLSRTILNNKYTETNIVRYRNKELILDL